MTSSIASDIYKKMTAKEIIDHMSSSLQGETDAWKKVARAVVGAIVDCLVWRRDHQRFTLTPAIIRAHMTFEQSIRLSHDKDIPADLRDKLIKQLDELPGFIYSAFDAEGNQKPGYDEMEESAVSKQQFGYLCSLFKFE